MTVWRSLTGLVVVAALVGVSLYHQARREKTLGEKVAEALAASSEAGRFTPAPPVLRAPQDPPLRNTFTLELNGRRHRIEVQARMVDVHGEIQSATILDPDPRLGNGPTLSAGIHSRRLSTGVTHITVTTPAPVPLRVVADDYSFELTPTSAPLRKLLEQDASPLASALGRHAGGEASATQWIDAARAELRALPDRALFDELLAADVALLQREHDPARVAQRGLLLLAREPVASVLVREPVFILSHIRRTPGRSHVRAWRASNSAVEAVMDVDASGSIDPARLRQVIFAVLAP